MKIDPKTFALCTLERDEIRAGLELRAANLSRVIARKRAHLSLYDGRRPQWTISEDKRASVLAEVDMLERKAARAADLLAAFADLAPAVQPDAGAVVIRCGFHPCIGFTHDLTLSHLLTRPDWAVPADEKAALLALKPGESVALNHRSYARVQS